ncbi:MAG: ATP-binding protein [Desulfobulbaceae bacterium]
MNFIPRPRFFLVSPWLLAAATALLVLIIVTFTVVNIRREEQLMTESLLQKADTLIRIVHSGSRSAFFEDLRRGVWHTESWREYVQRVIDHVVEDPDVRFLAVVDDTSRVIAHSDAGMIGATLDFILPENPPTGVRFSPLGYRIARNGDQGRVFEAVRPFYPYRSFFESIPHSVFGNRSPRQLGVLQRRIRQKSAQEGLEGRNLYVLVGLDMNRYDTSLKRIKLQTFVLSLVMLLVGLGGWLSLAAVQGFRVSQRTLSEMKLFTQLLLARLPVGIIAVDRDRVVTTFNEAAATMTGRETEYVIGRSAGAVLPGAFAEFFSREEGKATDEREITFETREGQRHYLCHLIEIEGVERERQGRVLLISDLTQLKGLEREMRENERLAAVGRMAAGVAHEVRNPLSSIKGLALLLRGRFPEEGRDRETADLLVEQVERMNRTVSELLSFARPAPLDLQPVSLQELLVDTLRLVEADTAGSGIATTLDVASNLRKVAGDPDRLSQVFLNLLLNAVQAMEKGGELRVSAFNSPEHEAVTVQIRDTGCGIGPEHRGQLFYPYFTTKKGGTGIGLAISQKIVSEHHGTISLDSEEGKGTTATVRLPIFTSNEPAQS